MGLVSLGGVGEVSRAVDAVEELGWCRCCVSSGVSTGIVSVCRFSFLLSSVVTLSCIALKVS